jgi:two-component system sensor histidine kinase BaeS
MIRSLRGRLFAATLGALAVTLVLTIGIGAVLTRRQVDRSQAAALARRADDLAYQRRHSVSYVNENVLTGRTRTIVAPRPRLVAYVPDIDADSDGTTTYDGHRQLYAYRTLPSRGLLVLRPAGTSGAWHPFLVDLLLAGSAGVLVAAVLSLLLARSVARPVGRVADATQALAAGGRAEPVPETGPAELESLARSFNEMADQLAASRETERNFLLSVSHELKTPLTAIRGYAEGLAEGAFAPDDAAQTILVESRRLERLVQDLLDLARMNRREFSVRREPVDLAEVARQAVARHEASARSFGVDLVADAVETFVEADPDRVLQIASNLIENALHETPPAGVVTVRTEPRRLVVADTGPGLEPDDLARAFDRFYLYDKHGRERPLGSGLGLAIVKQLGVAMGGDVTVESVSGAGAVFTLELPRSPSREPARGYAGRRSTSAGPARP